MPNPMHLPAGVATATKRSALVTYPRPDPTKTYTYFNDFDTYVSGDWTVTDIGVSTQALVADEPFGALALTTAGADNDGSQIQLKTETFTITAGKKTWFKARFKVSDATESDFAIGLIILDTTILGSTDGDGATDGIFFSKEDGDTALDINCQKNTTTGQLRATSIATVGTAYMSVAFEYDGKSAIRYWVDDVQKGTLAVSSTYLPDTPITVSAALLAGEGAAKVMTIDYFFAAQER